ncbi:hypothetical protein MAR621_03016 [Maribacter dokdonensis]|uniref:hypothetical protein n=1 Tax=Maribacter dokdonensis TaxID=320912 RepID=UPI001B164461|nr:hypothetical protein [Maribacter dokdonensis]CAG2532822.1 hypothetical protein MAR621_03016 [Maribacter dokdonensis]|tara:strand:- start:183 stop:1043 length:861 start_codon:yes stop_codon:yes gene_type:complete
MDIKDIQRHIDQVMNEQNNRSIQEFEGYSPFEMHHILNLTFETNSPISFQKLADSDYATIPIHNQIKYYLDLIKKTCEIKLTAKGFLPVKIVKDIYAQGYLEEPLFATGTYQLYKESDSMTVNLTRLLGELSGLTKKRNGKLSLTKKGENITSDNFELFKLIFKTITTKFNWAYYDGYGDNQIGQLGFGFSLVLLHIYGETKRQDTFYVEKYFNAFPDLVDSLPLSDFATPTEQATSCYSLRTFDRFLDYFGLVQIKTVGEKWKPDKYIIKTDIFDKLIKVRPHNM